MDLTADSGIHWEQTGNDVTDGNETKQWTGKRLSDDSMVLALLGEYNGLLAIFQISLAGPGMVEPVMFLVLHSHEPVKRSLDGVAVGDG